MKALQKLLGIVGVVILTGCMATGKPFQVPVKAQENQAPQIFVYREFNILGSAASPDVFVNGKKVGTLRTGGYVSATLKLGQNKAIIGKETGDFWTNWGPENVDINIDAHENLVAYIKMTPDFSSVTPIFIPGPTPFITTVGTASVILEVLPEELALPEIAKTKSSQ